jgi:hypothetical protein
MEFTLSQRLEWLIVRVLITLFFLREADVKSGSVPRERRDSAPGRLDFFSP